VVGGVNEENPVVSLTFQRGKNLYPKSIRGAKAQKSAGLH
jgi:hypothetical protein